MPFRTKESRRRYYQKSQKHRHRRRWSVGDLERLKELDISDTELAAEIDRSVMAIQIRRCRLRDSGCSVKTKQTQKKGTTCKT